MAGTQTVNSFHQEGINVNPNANLNVMVEEVKTLYLIAPHTGDKAMKDTSRQTLLMNFTEIGVKTSLHERR